MADFLEFMNGFVNTAKEQITELAKAKLNNADKKAKLDEVITTFAEKTLEKAKLNIFVKLTIKKLVIPHIADLTQIIYDLLKAKVTGVTVKEETKDDEGAGK